ncbi:hypothetical protein [Massilia sp. TWR1-2-2]|uniref:hypothetical protein n=1 Tax=Massilia sp. TWR1-2-2 TaxID=2804584 RepID=UPI003CF34042
MKGGDPKRLLAVIGGSTVGAVTVVDGRDAISNRADVGERGCLELIDVRLHLLPSGSRYSVAEAPAPLRHFVEIITRRTAQA